MKYRLGLDTGGTYTDAVLLDQQNKLVAEAKSLTTHHDLALGLGSAVSAVLAQHAQRLSAEPSPVSAPGSSIELVCLSTTLATNALVEGRGRPVALVLIGYTENQFRRARLPAALDGEPLAFIAGGHDAAGQELAALDAVALQEFVEQQQQQVEAFAVSAMFAVRNPEHEIQAREIIRGCSGKPVSCGHELSSALDAPRRALTALLNARLIPLLSELMQATALTLSEQQIDAPLMVVKGDGSLVSSDFARNSPVETILSGPAASVVGARFLSARKDLLVSDIGGTTTDIALLRNGLPKLDSAGATVGGWRTMVRAVMINTHGLGGDSAVVFNRELRDFAIGPQRVVPLSQLIADYPHLLEILRAQLELGYSATYAAQFALAASAQEPPGLSAQQRELWHRIAGEPRALLQLFEDQTLDRPLSRLVQRGFVLKSGFTPTDASHILGRQCDWDTQAAQSAAQILMRYSEHNLGPQFSSVQDFASYISSKLARNTAMALIEVALAEHAGLPTLNLTSDERRFIEQVFAPAEDMPLKLGFELDLPIAGIGAPAASYYPAVASLLNAPLDLPDHGAVANAIGAVVGSVRQSQTLSITPSGGKKVRVHSDAGPLEFDELEQAASWCVDTLSASVAELARQAGAADFELSVERHDNLVEQDGQSVFFESTITVCASGRPSTASMDQVC